MTEQIMKHQSKMAKKTQRVLKYVNMVVEVGEIVSSKEIIFRMNNMDGLPTKKGTIPMYYIPKSSTSLGMRLRIAKNFEQLPKTRGNKSHWKWRRIS